MGKKSPKGLHNRKGHTLCFLHTLTGNSVHIASFEILLVHWPKCTIYETSITWIPPNRISPNLYVRVA